MTDDRVEKYQIYQGDCLDILSKLAPKSVDLIVTSPHMPISAKILTAELIPIFMSNGFCQLLMNSSVYSKESVPDIPTAEAEGFYGPV